MTELVLVNGVEQSHIDVRDRGLQYGDGVFETMAVVDHRVRNLQAHLQRLSGGCERLALACPQAAVVIAELAHLAQRQPRAVLKLIVTRGIGGRGYRAPQGIEPTRLVALHEWPDYPAAWWEEGVAVRVCRTRIGDSPALAGLKHLNRLEQVLARSEWQDAQLAEGLMLDVRDHVVCGTMSNVFAVMAGTLHTPSLQRCGVRGTMRQAVLAQAAKLGIAVHETELGLPELLQAEELFLTNALIGVWPVRSLDQRPYRVGPVTRWLQREVS